jgi:hypothetical protein
MQVTGSVGTRLYTVPATDTALLVDENDPVFGRKSRVYGTDLYARRMGAVVTEFRNEKAPEDIPLRIVLTGFLPPLPDADHLHRVILSDQVPFDPGPIKIGQIRHIVLFLAGADAATAPDAQVDVDPHAVEVLLGIVCLQGRLTLD